MKEPTGAECSRLGLAMATAERIAISYEATYHAIGHQADFCEPRRREIEEGHPFNVAIIDAAAHILAKTNPELSAALCLESERMLHELAKEE